MPSTRIPVNGLGKAGFVADVQPFELPPEPWSAVSNVRFEDGRAKKIAGHEPVYGTPTVVPQWILHVVTPSANLLVYTSLTKAYAVDSARIHTNITRQTASVDVDYTATNTLNWNGGVLNGIPFLNNGVDPPQMWSPPNTSTKLVALTAWPAATTCRCLRAFKKYLVAMDMTESGTRLPHKIRWSHEAPDAAMPTTWDPTDTTKDAGFTTLGDANGAILDCLGLGDVNVVYKEAETWAMHYVGGNQVFRFNRLFGEGGMLSRNCAVAYYHHGVKHAVFGSDDIYIHNGGDAKSIIRGRNLKWLFGQLGTTTAYAAFAVSNPAKTEIWFCFPTTGQTTANKALIWNWEQDTFAVRDLPNVRYAASGFLDDSGASELWNNDTAVWDSDITTWDTNPYQAVSKRLLLPSISDTRIHLADVTNRFNGVNFTGSLERSGNAIARQDRFGNPKADPSIRKLLKEIWPRIEAQPGTTVSIYAGATDDENAAVNWKGPFQFVVGTHRKVNPLVAGRFLATRYENASDATFNLLGHDLVIAPLGAHIG